MVVKLLFDDYLVECLINCIEFMENCLNELFVWLNVIRVWFKRLYGCG